MASSNSTLSKSRLKELLHYNPNTGTFTNLTKRAGNCNVGDVSGCIHVTNDGKKYRCIEIDGRKYLAHRLVFLYVAGSFPPDQVDHGDGNGLNNRLTNLSLSTNKENGKNQRLSSNNKSGISGVYWHKNLNKWHSQITVNHKKKHLGYFTTLIAAAYAKHAANIKHGFHENHGSIRDL